METIIFAYIMLNKDIMNKTFVIENIFQFEINLKNMKIIMSTYS